MLTLSWSTLVSKVRSLLVPVALAWLFVHVSVVAGTTALLLTSGASEADIICTCAHGADHGSCPMHGKPADAARCRLQSTQNDLGLALLSMLGPLTLPVATARYRRGDLRTATQGLRRHAALGLDRPSRRSAASQLTLLLVSQPLHRSGATAPRL